ncbi:MAG: cyclic nucleotide-binding/CBS domain-containing protein [Pirellulaceae bacterium]
MSGDTRGGTGEAYQDPLEDYESRQYDDPLELALAEETVQAIQTRPYVSVPSDASVGETVRRLVDLDVACVLVEEEGRLIGLVSERDVLNKVALEYEQVKDLPVTDLMTPNPICVYETDSSAAVLSVMAATGYRHVPVVDLDEKLVGIVGPVRITAFLQKRYDEFAE